MMRRNLIRRVEALVPIRSAALRERLHEVLELNLADDTLAWAMLPDGSYERVPVERGLNSHLALEALEAQRGRPKIRRDA